MPKSFSKSKHHSLHETRRKNPNKTRYMKHMDIKNSKDQNVKQRIKIHIFFTRKENTGKAE